MNTVTSDPLLAHARRGAAEVVRLLNTVPAAQRLSELDRVLRQQDATLPQRVRATANRLAKSGMAANAAVQEAIARSLADHTIAYYKGVGRRGELGALGQTPAPAPQTPQGQDSGKVIQNVVGGVACSTTLQNAIAGLVGKSEGISAHDAVTTGFAIAGGVSGGCQQATATTPSAPPPPPAPPPSRLSAVVPLLIGAGIVVAVGVVVVKTGRYHAARHAAQGT